MKIWWNESDRTFLRSTADLSRFGYHVVWKGTALWEDARTYFEAQGLKFP